MSASNQSSLIAEATLAESTCSPPVIPDHKLLQRIGRGSYGEVWLGRSTLGSFRAVKIVYRKSFDHDKPYEREFEGLKRFEPISHARESQVNIFHVGRNDESGFFYYIMELADSASEDSRPKAETGQRTQSPNFHLRSPAIFVPRTLKHDLRTRGALPVAECLQFALSLGRALEHLHAHGLVHRDIKPSNIIFVNGVPKLADIGLVTSVDATRSFVGTDGYIPPEGPGTPQADLYSLGKVLYECVTGKDRLDFPELPADLRTRPDFEQLLEFNEILTKACDAEPSQRYQSTTSLLAELQSIERGKSLKRDRAFRQMISRGKTLALAGGALAVVAVIAYWLPTLRSPRSDSPQPFGWSTNAAAREEFLKGVRFLQADTDNGRAIECFHRAIQLDPKFAEAYARLAWAHYSFGEDDPNPLEGPAAAEKAVALNPKLAYAHSMLATARFASLNWAQGEKERAIAIGLIKPNSPSAQEILLESALNLACSGYPNEALRDLQSARLANPDSASKKRELFYGLVYAWCRQYDRAFEVWSQLPKDDSYFLNDQKARAYLGMGNFTNFIRFSKQAALAHTVDKERVNGEFDALETAFKQRGEHGFWELRQKMEADSQNSDRLKRDPDCLMRMGAIYARLNQRDEAFRYLKRAMQETPVYFCAGLYTNPSFDSLREDQRFREIFNQLWGRK